MPYIVLTTNLNGAKLISTERLNLELLTDRTDLEQLVELGKKNLAKRHIQSLYAERPEYIDEHHVKFQMYQKFERNTGFEADDKEFSKLYYVLKLKSGEIIGTLEMYGCREGIEFGLFIDQDHSHQKFGTEALTAAIEFIKKNSSIPTAKWECNADNIGSVGVAKKCGFVHQNDWKIYEGRIASTFLLTLRP